MTKSVLLLLGISFVLCGCKRDTGFDITLPNKDIILNNVPYGDDSLQKMDVYLPANRAPKTKIIVYLHGGSWYAGDKGEIKNNAIYFQQKGYAVISINYRLTRTAANNINPAQVQDIGRALDFISEQSVRWIITGNRICLYGGSAGAHLSLLYAYKYNENKKVKAVVSVSGPLDLTDPNIMNTSFKKLIESFVGSKMADNKQAWLEASPAHYISESSVPTLFFQGKKDNLVPYRQVVSAYNELQKLGVNTELKLFPNVGHDLLEDNDDILTGIEEFINTAFP